MLGRPVAGLSQSKLALRSRADLAIVVNLEPGRPVARDPLTPVRVAEHQVTHRPAAGVGVPEAQPGQIATAGLRTSRAIAECTDRHTRRNLGIVSAHGFSTRPALFS
jgi:hypothetical protein